MYSIINRYIVDGIRLSNQSQPTLVSGMDTPSLMTEITISKTCYEISLVNSMGGTEPEEVNICGVHFLSSFHIVPFQFWQIGPSELFFLNLIESRRTISCVSYTGMICRKIVLFLNFTTLYFFCFCSNLLINICSISI